MTHRPALAYLSVDLREAEVRVGQEERQEELAPQTAVNRVDVEERARDLYDNTRYKIK